MERSAALDFSRFAAALVVFSGHLFFVPNSMNWSDSTILFLNPIRTGDTAVLFFFALSGYVLSLGSRKEFYFGWVVSRIVRLFPIYICAWFLGFGLVVLHKSELISSKVVLLGVIGFQSLDPEVMLYVNAPLWSLSVEIVVAFFLIFLLKLKSRPFLLFFFLIFALVFWMNFSWSPILRALPFFLLGILISNEKVRSLYPRSRVSLIIIFVGGVFYCFRGASWLVDLPSDIASDMYKLFLVSFLIFLLSRIEISKRKAKYAIACGKRSFSLYAFHYPILLAMNYFIQPASLLSFAIYAALSLIGTFACTEFAYRFVDRPSMAASKRVKAWFF